MKGRWVLDVGTTEPLENLWSTRAYNTLTCLHTCKLAVYNDAHLRTFTGNNYGGLHYSNHIICTVCMYEGTSSRFLVG